MQDSCPSLIRTQSRTFATYLISRRPSMRTIAFRANRHEAAGVAALQNTAPGRAPAGQACRPSAQAASRYFCGDVRADCRLALLFARVVFHYHSRTTLMSQGAEASASGAGDAHAAWCVG